MKKILIVEEDVNLIKKLILGFAAHNFDVTTASSVPGAQELISKIKYDLIIIDINVAQGKAIEICKSVKDSNASLPIMAISSDLEEKMALKAFSVGVEDYVRKPFVIEEIILRTNRILERVTSKNNVPRYKSMKLDRVNEQVIIKGKAIRLTKTEMIILEILLNKRDQIISREHFLSVIDEEGKIFDRAIDKTISRLRIKLNKVKNIDFEISAIYGLGYRLIPKRI